MVRFSWNGRFPLGCRLAFLQLLNLGASANQPSFATVLKKRCRPQSLRDVKPRYTVSGAAVNHHRYRDDYKTFSLSRRRLVSHYCRRRSGCSLVLQEENSIPVEPFLVGGRIGVSRVRGMGHSETWRRLLRNS